MATKKKQTEQVIDNTEEINKELIEISEASKEENSNAYSPEVDTVYLPVDWRALIEPKYIVVNNQYKETLEKQYKKPIEELDISELDDKYKLILLAGLKNLAKLRGYQSVDYQVIQATPEYAAVKCTIIWTQFDNEISYSFSALADAHYSNCDNFSKPYIMATAENRAFTRCVRSSLGIHIVGKDEIGTNAIQLRPEKPTSPSDPVFALTAKLQKNKTSFEDFKVWWAKENPEALNWKTEAEIPAGDIWVILNKIAQLESKKVKA